MRWDQDTENNEESGDNAQNAHKQLPTWADLMHDMVNCSCEMDWDDAPAENQNLKPQGGDHKLQLLQRQSPEREITYPSPLRRNRRHEAKMIRVWKANGPACLESGGLLVDW